MKLRFWQKAYLFTLILFLLCLNAGILSLTVYTHQENAAAVESAAAAEQSYIAMSFERDMETLAESDGSSPSLLMQSFGNFYRQQGLYLSFARNGHVLYSSIPFPCEPEANTLKHMDVNDRRYLLIASPVCDGEYTLLMVKNVESLDTEFQALMVTFVLTALLVSGFLAVCLYFILRRLSKPLEILQTATEQIRQGNFSAVIPEAGNDEFTLLAKSFNAMTGKINAQMGALEQESHRKQMLVDNLAHELRTPLTSIHGYAEFLEKAAASQEQRIVAAKYILSESERLQKISQLLLDAAIIRGNAPDMEERALSPILEDVAQKLQQKAAASGVQLLCRAEPASVYGNETLLSMLFYNLAENAIKACTEGGTVILACKDHTATVADNGKGMTPEQLNHITEPFYRTDKARARAEGGAGLGLALCIQICQSHRAQLNFTSQVGLGTTVTITFTARQQDGENTATSPV